GSGASGGAVHLVFVALPCRRNLLLYAKHLLVAAKLWGRNVLMRRLLLAGVAALSVLTATAAAHAETKEARVILPDTITGTWCWVEGGDEKNRNQQIFIRSAPEDCHVSECPSENILNPLNRL